MTKPGGSQAQSLHVDPRLDSPDDFYAAIIELHRDLDDDQSRLVNAKLILLLANHIGDVSVLQEAIAVARNGVAE